MPAVYPSAVFSIAVAQAYGYAPISSLMCQQPTATPSAQISSIMLLQITRPPQLRLVFSIGLVVVIAVLF